MTTETITKFMGPKSARSRGSRISRSFSLAPENYDFLQDLAKSSRKPISTVIDELVDGYRGCGTPTALMKETKDLSVLVKQLLTEILQNYKINCCNLTGSASNIQK